MTLAPLMAQSGTFNDDSEPSPAAALRSFGDTQLRVPLRSTQLASEIRVKMPSVTAPVLTASISSSWRPSGMTSLPTRNFGSVSFATAVAAGISVRNL